jgi:hypothetical protein
MRKGRAQRKSRSSRVPAPSKAPQVAAEGQVGAADSAESLEAVVTVVAAPASEPDEHDEPRATSADEISIPPAGDLAVHEKFFSEGDVGAHLAGDDLKAHEPWEDTDKTKPAKHHPHVVERRQRFARYVGFAVAGATVLCVAALARTALTTPAPLTPRDAGKSVAAANALVVAPPTAAPAKAEEAKAIEPKAPEPKAIEPKAPEPKAIEVAPAPAPVQQPVQVQAAEPAPKAEAPAAEVAAARTAREEKNASRNALERRKLDDAIAAGERSVALDAADGEAWLILGAAYQEKGKLADARRCYAACLKEGKRGPKSECAAMLR